MQDYQNRILALLGVAATKEAQQQPCPSDNILSAFIEDRADIETRKMMLSHLNQCEICYLTWEQLNIQLSQNKPKALLLTNAEKIKTRQHQTTESNTGFSWQKSVLGLVLASLLIALLMNMLVTSYNTNTDNSTMASSATLDAGTLATSIQQFPVPWKNQPFVLNDSTYALPVKAFGIGAWIARNALMNKQDPLPDQLASDPTIDWEMSEWRDYHRLGHLTLDAWVLANAENVNPKQWTRMKESLQKLQISLQKRRQSELQASIALQMIDQMKESLKRLSQKADYSAQKALIQNIETGLEKLID